MITITIQSDKRGGGKTTVAELIRKKLRFVPGVRVMVINEPNLRLGKREKERIGKRPPHILIIESDSAPPKPFWEL